MSNSQQYTHKQAILFVISRYVCKFLRTLTNDIKFLWTNHCQTSPPFLPSRPNRRRYNSWVAKMQVVLENHIRTYLCCCMYFYIVNNFKIYFHVYFRTTMMRIAAYILSRIRAAIRDPTANYVDDPCPCIAPTIINIITKVWQVRWTASVPWRQYWKICLNAPALPASRPVMVSAFGLVYLSLPLKTSELLSSSIANN